LFSLFITGRFMLAGDPERHKQKRREGTTDNFGWTMMHRPNLPAVISTIPIPNAGRQIESQL
jgi:hypothetical protein